MKLFSILLITIIIQENQATPLINQNENKKTMSAKIQILNDGASINLEVSNDASQVSSHSEETWTLGTITTRNPACPFTMNGAYMVGITFLSNVKVTGSVSGYHCIRREKPA